MPVDYSQKTTTTGTLDDDINRSGSLGVYDLFQKEARRHPDGLAIETISHQLTYGQLLDRVDRLAALFQQKGIETGDRIAILSENRSEYIEVHLASAKIGAIVACQNWRLAPGELKHCIDLVSPSLLIYSELQDHIISNLDNISIPQLTFGRKYETALMDVTPQQTSHEVPGEAGLIILYTSGTTGPAKAALISHRALIARMCLLSIDLKIDDGDSYLAWPPMFHMGGTEHSLSTLMMGGAVVVSQGFDADYMADVISRHRLGWLMLVPGTFDRLKEAIKRLNTSVKGIKAVGAMADLLPKSTIVEMTNFFNAPFFNTFGATETGLPPASGQLIPPGVFPETLSKELSSLCLMRIVGKDNQDVQDGEVGEALVRGPTLFSGYWSDPETNARDFVGGWFRMGDLFRKNADNTVDFVGRAKYLIKSGGENIYPAEIENVLLSDPDVSDAVVVRKPDAQWGEVPVAVVARSDQSLNRDHLSQLCRSHLAGYKQPREIHFVDFDELPRNSNGKIIREEIEQWLGEKH